MVAAQKSARIEKIPFKPKRLATATPRHRNFLWPTKTYRGAMIRFLKFGHLRGQNREKHLPTGENFMVFDQ